MVMRKRGKEEERGGDKRKRGKGKKVQGGNLSFSVSYPDMPSPLSSTLDSPVKASCLLFVSPTLRCLRVMRAKIKMNEMMNVWIVRLG